MPAILELCNDAILGWVQRCAPIPLGSVTKLIIVSCRSELRPDLLDEITLRRLYLEEERSIRDIACLANVPTRTVYDALIRYRIPRRAAGFHQKSPQPARASLDEATLRRLYQQEQRS